MTKKKSSVKKNGSRHHNGAKSTSSDNKLNCECSLLGAAFAGFFALIAVLYAAVITSNIPIVNQIQLSGGDRHQVKEKFLQWFVDNGGAFYPIGSGKVNVTIDEFLSYGGWGLALPISPDRECQPDTDGQCTAHKSLIIRHLEPLFTVPSSLIISVESILDTYASTSSPLYLPNFYPTVNKILTNAFPNGHGLARRGMGMVEQDAVIAMYLLVENCHHIAAYLSQLNRQMTERIGIGSHWGPYLEVLPPYTVPRLDTFGDEEYAALQDEKLEQTGRSSRRLLEQMFGDDKAGGPSMQTVMQDMMRKKIGTTFSPDYYSSCISFEEFHKFVAIVSSRAMALKGVKHLTPLAEMINYAPKIATQNEEGQDRSIQAPFDLYHTLSEDGSITVRSDRDIFLPETSDESGAMIQIFEDYGPVDSSLFLEAHGFVPHENPNNCATISGLLFLRRNAAAGRYDENVELVLRALKALHLVHPDTKKLEALDDVCVLENLGIIDDGKTRGRKPASDIIAISSILLGDNDNPVWSRIESKYRENFVSLRNKCTAAIGSTDPEWIEIRCARYPGSGSVVKHSLRRAARRAIAGFEAAGDTESNLLMQHHNAVSEDKYQLALALRFRMHERIILIQIAQTPDEIVYHETGVENQIMESSESPDNLEEKLQAFDAFIESLQLPLNKIEPKLVGSGMRIGAFATEDLDVGDAYISLPPNAVIDVTTALATVDPTSALAALLKKYSNNSKDGFDALVLYLLHERFVIKAQSQWWPYLNLFPTIDELIEYHPLFFKLEEIDRHLAGSDVRQSIVRYQRRAAERHKALLSDLDANLVLGSDVLLDRQMVYWATAIVDSRSIWWGGKRHLSPLLDLVNADSKGHPHETNLEDSEDMQQKVAVTRASRRVQKGEQIFENYGQPNYLLFTYHGFLLEENTDDCALLDGLFIHRDDPGAKSAHQHLRSATPTFCIRDEASVEELAHFLRVKHGLSLDNTSTSNIDEEVRPYLIQVLEGRIARLTEAVDAKSDTEISDLPRRVQFMRQMEKNDLKYFQEALNTHVVA